MGRLRVDDGRHPWTKDVLPNIGSSVVPINGVYVTWDAWKAEPVVTIRLGIESLLMEEASAIFIWHDWRWKKHWISAFLIVCNFWYDVNNYYVIRCFVLSEQFSGYHAGWSSVCNADKSYRTIWWRIRNCCDIAFMAVKDRPLVGASNINPTFRCWNICLKAVLVDCDSNGNWVMKPCALLVKHGLSRDSYVSLEGLTCFITGLII